jgi:DNA-binding NtrC family response regulator
MTSQAPSFQQQNIEAMRQKRILVIEHHPVIAEFLLSTLSLSEYGSSTIGEIDLASQIWRESHIETPPDGIIIDIDLRRTPPRPRDFMNRFRKQWQSTSSSTPIPPLILLTTQPLACQELRQEGYTVLMKPFKPHILLNHINSAIEKKERRKSAISDKQSSLIVCLKK